MLRTCGDISQSRKNIIKGFRFGMSSFNSYEQTELNTMRGSFDESCRSLRELYFLVGTRSWGLRPRLYAVARSAGFVFFVGARSWGLRPRLYAVAHSAGFIFCWDAVLGLTPQALCCRPLRGLGIDDRTSLDNRLGKPLHLFQLRTALQQ